MTSSGAYNTQHKEITLQRANVNRLGPTHESDGFLFK